MLRHSRGRAVALGVITTAGSVAALLLPAAIGRTLDLLLTRHHHPSTTAWLAVSAALLGLAFVFDALGALLTSTTDARNIAWLRGRMLARLLGAGVTHRFAPGDLAARCTGNAAMAGTVPTSLAAALSALVTPVGAIVALGLINPWLCAVFLAGAPALFLLLRAFTRATSDCVTRYQQAQGEIAGALAEALAGARTVAAAGTEVRESERVLAALPELRRQGHRMWQVQGRATTQAAVLVPLLQTAVLAVAGLELAAGRLSVGDLLAASRYAALATGVGALVGQLDALVRGRAAAERAGEPLDLPVVGYGTAELTDDAGELELRGVTVRREGTVVLDRLDLRVPGGTSVAVVGRSGSGKSVLAAVAGRLTDPDEGTVLLDGVPLPRLSHRELRREVGYAFERPALFGVTVSDAIGYGAWRPTDGQLAGAARAARADAFVALLPHGYDTDRDTAPLSGGENQRLGLARAFAHAGRLLILDDATSSLDTVTERQVTDAILADEPARTRLLIAHRAATAARATTVAWLDGGRLRALAPHRQLWHDPAYRAVFDAEGDTR